MSKHLLIAFDDAEVAASGGLIFALGLPVDVLNLTGSATAGAQTWLAKLPEVPPADALAAALVSLVAGYSHVSAVSSMRSKDVMARLAGLLDAAMVTDVVGVASPTEFHRPIVAGSLLATVQVLSEPVVLTFRPGSFVPAPVAASENVREVTPELAGTTVRTHVGARGGARPDLTQAKVVVSGGRPLKDADTFERVLGGLADALGGAVGATRAAVDSGIAPNELQVGQTGKIVAPDLYIAAGISGSTQHMAGIKDSKVIVAINKDADAPIFEMADLGLVADLYEVLPQLESELPKVRNA
ncbi:MAG: FAD-binding protein [Fimbriimonadaceae bacterium]|nr:FAD-binding protein [Fimbriimonadaceae bacterium]